MKYSKEENRRWQNNLPAKRVSAGALLWNEQGELLIGKPNYRDFWILPGGVVDEAESPLDAVVREVREEYGLHLAKASLHFKAISYQPARDGFKDFLSLLFDGGVLSRDEVAAIVLQQAELDSYQFMPAQEATELLSHSKAKLVSTALSADSPVFVTTPDVEA